MTDPLLCWNCGTPMQVWNGVVWGCPICYRIVGMRVHRCYRKGEKETMV